jgi:hypothetical protein
MIKHNLLPHTSAMRQNAAKISYTNFRVTSVLTQKRHFLKVGVYLKLQYSG